MEERERAALQGASDTLRTFADARSWSTRNAHWAVPAILAFVCLPYGMLFALTAPALIVPMTVPLAVLGGLIVWALPEKPNPPTRTMSALFFAFATVLVAWPNYIAIALPGLPWITLIRLFSFPMAILLLVSVSTSATFRTTLGDALRSTPLIWPLLAIFVLTQLITIPLSPDISTSVQRVVVYQATWTATFFVTTYIFLKPKMAQQFVAMLCLAAVALSIMALFEFQNKNILWANSIPSIFKIDDAERYLKPAYRSATKIYRVKAVFGHPLVFAEFLALTVPFFIHFVMTAKKLVVKVAASAALLLIIHAITLTDSRLGIVGILIAISLYMLLWGLLRWRRLRDSIVAPAILLAYPVMFVGVVAATFVVNDLRMKVWGSGAHAASDASRDAQVAMGLPKILANPIGHGAASSGTVLGYYSQGMLTIDNYYLMVALEYGVLGFITFYGMILAGIYYSSLMILKTSRSKDGEISLLLPTAIALTSFFVIKSVFSQQDNHALIFMLLGLVVALVYRSKLELAGSSRPKVRTNA